MTTIGLCLVLLFVVRSICDETPEVLKPGRPPHKGLELMYQRKQIDFMWVHGQDRRKALKEKTYIPINNAISGVKVWKNQMFLTVPRWKDGVPATLTRIDLDHLPGAPNLMPFPNWDMQQIGNCSRLQFVQEIDINNEGQMWIIDTGKLLPIDGSAPKGKICPAKIIVVDLKSYNFSPWYSSKFDQQIQITLNYTFPDNIANDKSYLDDLVLDTQAGFAYIVDFGPKPGLIVFNYNEQTSYRLEDKTMGVNLLFPPVTIGGVSVYIGIRGLNGIALSPQENNRTLYFCPLSSRDIYAVPASALQTNTSISKEIKKVGERSSISDGLMIDNKNNLYFGLNEADSLGVWDLKKENKTTKVLFKDNKQLQWIDAMGIGDDGYLYMVSNRLQNMLKNKVNPKEINYRVLRTYIGAKNYVHPLED